MKVDKREVAATLAPGAVLALWALGGWGLFTATLEPAERTALGAMLEPRGALLLLGWLVLSGVLGWLARAAYLRWVAASARLAEEARVLLAADVQREIAPEGSAETKALAEVINQLARQRDGLRADVAEQVREASRSVEQERNRLAALMAELTQSVVVCNLDGRILLYNSRARTQFRALSTAPAVGGGAELIGLGRSIYTVFDRALIAHALESVQQRLQRGAAHPSAQFVTGTRAGQLLRVQMAPVRAIDASNDEAALNGFVLMLENITRDFADESERDKLLHGLTEGSRASLGNLQAAVEMLDYEDVDAATRERFHGVIRDEVGAMSQRIQQLASHTAQTMKTRWPLEEMLGADLVAAAARRIEAQCGCRVATDGVDAALWLKVDSFSVLQALVYLAGRLVDEYEIKLVQLRLAVAAGRARLDLAWIGQAMSTETVMGWETDTMRIGTESLALTVRDVVERHDGAFWFERERVRHESFFRLLLPLAASSEQLDAAQFVRSESRPEVYDFDLFRASEQSRELADHPLAELSYTVFDTETTGLAPSEGDEIIQIGATRIVAGKLRREDCFEQLVDPRRDIPEASIPIHGITPAMVAGAPAIDTVLPAFHAFAQDTVLVAHNAAFDMRFLELKQAATGVVFDQPVLDTLLLSAVVHPQQESHRLEAIAERLGVPILGRHTAVGDAMVTAEIFLKLIPLLAERGIHTLGQAREAAQKTYFARVSY
ncbi:DNA polymerase III subunit epsilon [Rhizobacter sp. AJA081-3]|uniref:3'-5' exonuclease n=1 Tax=Rhizobacter sp. AJA081-3 TaxID=2753607 RepID=UPI001ADF98E7|nr:exonuclease domain-containing protein [Rhizobacter sp. AJA081-3]QTN22428.1 DNA polymerase III subunit epsilon [Rhizobacter sp. AJA081-3]